MNILYLTPEGFNTPNPNNQLVMVLLRELLKKNNKVYVVQSKKSDTFDDIPEMLKNKDNLVVETIIRKKIDKKSFIKRYLNEFRWAFQSYNRCKKIKKKVDVVILQSCPTAVYELILLKLFFRKPIVFNVYDLWPGNLIESGITKSKFLVYILKKLQKIGYKCCKKIIVLSEDMRQKLIEEKIKSNKVDVVPAWYDDENVREISFDENRFISKYPKPGNFVVQFAGSIGYVFNYDVVLDTAKLLAKYADIVFQIVGDGIFKEEFMKKTKENGITNIYFYPLQPVELVPDVYSACNVEIIPLRKAVIGVGVPSKAPLVMACRRVIINSLEDSPYSRLFFENNMGISVSYNDSKALAKSILKLYNDQELYKTMSTNAYEFAKNNYSSSICVEKFNAILERTLKN